MCTIYGSVLTGNSLRVPCTRVKGFVEQIRGLVTKEAVKARMQRALDGRQLTWLAERVAEYYPNLTSESIYKTVQRYVTGNVEPPIDFVAYFCEVLGVNEAWVLAGKGSMLATAEHEAEARLRIVQQALQRPLEELVTFLGPEDVEKF